MFYNIDTWWPTKENLASISQTSSSLNACRITTSPTKNKDMFSALISIKVGSSISSFGWDGSPS